MTKKDHLGCSGDFSHIRMKKARLTKPVKADQQLDQVKKCDSQYPEKVVNEKFAIENKKPQDTGKYKQHITHGIKLGPSFPFHVEEIGKKPVNEISSEHDDVEPSRDFTFFQQDQEYDNRESEHPTEGKPFGYVEGF
jgi:hypothetical protein